MCIGIRRKAHLIVFSVPETICKKHSKCAPCLQECLYTVNNPRVQWSELLHWREVIVDLLYTNSLSNHLAVLKTLCHQIFHFTSANPDCRATSRSYIWPNFSCYVTVVVQAHEKMKSLPVLPAISVMCQCEWSLAVDVTACYGGTTETFRSFVSFIIGK